jgi:hypothetical protein
MNVFIEVLFYNANIALRVMAATASHGMGCIIELHSSSLLHSTGSNEVVAVLNVI